MIGIKMHLATKTLILWCISSVTSDVIEDRSVTSGGVIVGPETPVYYLEYPQPDYLKIRHLENVFEASPAYSYYSDPSRRDGTLFIKILVITDYYLYQNHNQQEIISDVLNEWNKVDDYFSKLKNTKVKIVISGLMIPKAPNIWNSPINCLMNETTIYEDSTVIEHYTQVKLYGVRSTLVNISNWILDHTDDFEYYFLDMFIYIYFFVLDDVDLSTPQVPHVSYMGVEPICADFLYGGLVQKNNAFSFLAAQIIAFGLQVGEDTNLGCEGGHIMDFSILDQPSITWSDCSERMFENLFNNASATCLKYITYREEYGDYDYE